MSVIATHEALHVHADDEDIVLLIGALTELGVPSHWRYVDELSVNPAAVLTIQADAGPDPAHRRSTHDHRARGVGNGGPARLIEVRVAGAPLEEP